MYKVIFFPSKSVTDLELEIWLNDRYAEGLRLVDAGDGGRFIFETKPMTTLVVGHKHTYTDEQLEEFKIKNF